MSSRTTVIVRERIRITYPLVLCHPSQVIQTFVILDNAEYRVEFFFYFFPFFQRPVNVIIVCESETRSRITR